MEGNKEKVKRAAKGMALGILFAFSLMACAVPENTPHAEPLSMPTKELENGRILFNQHCATCHPEGMAGVGLAIINKPLPASLIRFQIRNGVGVMPGFDEDVLSDEQVEHIAEYLVYLRKKD